MPIRVIILSKYATGKHLNFLLHEFFVLFLCVGEYVTIKQVATARYYRNHKLMAEIFNDSSVPDTRSGN